MLVIVRRLYVEAGMASARSDGGGGGGGVHRVLVMVWIATVDQVHNH